MIKQGFKPGEEGKKKKESTSISLGTYYFLVNTNLNIYIIFSKITANNLNANEHMLYDFIFIKLKNRQN